VAAEDGKKADPRIKSLTALSVPHLDAFSDGLYGPNADKDQQIASQYFTVFNLPDSAKLNFNLLYTTMALPILNSVRAQPPPLCLRPLTLLVRRTTASRTRPSTRRTTSRKLCGGTRNPTI
jgi:hypothetical protein